ncbi:hypothetical protein [Methylobacterium gregans]|uniref:Uncharacterized protein n=1 Tax=Methylobacterium gregans TaxID=374424 RepID=A0AA37HT60_9HYPH|nr:hypothetical protein [Methylobacterium gregans]MDQ0524147.1 hypothetical protein [Methylobacterium gregans]GJD81131.1 hypothetical protein NBEOAGPD_4376 [Methylobacterium gregans]GLS54859.1 hypothetical protein GCM10007886_30430 [Methylobacterium gregans]
MRLTIALVLLTVGTLVAGSFLNGAKSAETVTSATTGAASRTPMAEAVKKRLKLDANRREAADRNRQERTERLTKSVCVGCGGPVVPFDPSGGEAARKGISAARQSKR